jgi:hypothetical protein
LHSFLRVSSGHEVYAEIDQIIINPYYPSRGFQDNYDICLIKTLDSRSMHFWSNSFYSIFLKLLIFDMNSTFAEIFINFVSNCILKHVHFTHMNAQNDELQRKHREKNAESEHVID